VIATDLSVMHHADIISVCMMQSCRTRKLPAHLYHAVLLQMLVYANVALCLFICLSHLPVVLK